MKRNRVLLLRACEPERSEKKGNHKPAARGFESEPENEVSSDTSLEPVGSGGNHGPWAGQGPLAHCSLPLRTDEPRTSAQRRAGENGTMCLWSYVTEFILQLEDIGLGSVAV